MKAETPARGISKTGEWGDYVSYRVDCACSDDSHAVNAWIEAKEDSEMGHVDVEFQVSTITPVWSVNRWRAIWELLTRGHHRGSHTLILEAQAAVNFAEAIKESVQRLEKNTNKKAKR